MAITDLQSLLEQCTRELQISSAASCDSHSNTIVQSKATKLVNCEGEIVVAVDASTDDAV